MQTLLYTGNYHRIFTWIFSNRISYERGYVSHRFVGIALSPPSEKIEKKKRARGQKDKKKDIKMQKYKDVSIRRYEDKQM